MVYRFVHFPALDFLIPKDPDMSGWSPGFPPKTKSYDLEIGMFRPSNPTRIGEGLDKKRVLKLRHQSRRALFSRCPSLLVFGGDFYCNWVDTAQFGTASCAEGDTADI